MVSLADKCTGPLRFSRRPPTASLLAYHLSLVTYYCLFPASRRPRPRSPGRMRRFRGMASRALPFSGRVGFGPVGSVRAQDLREALRGRKSWQSRPPAEGDRRIGTMEQWNIEAMGWGSAAFPSIPSFHHSIVTPAGGCPLVPGSARVFRARRVSLRSYVRSKSPGPLQN